MSLPLHKQVMTRALQLIEDPAHWTNRAWARNEDGAGCSSTSKEAVRFCAVGALRRAAYDLTDNEKTAARLRTNASRALLGGGIQLFADSRLMLWNDRRGHDAVLKLFKRALAA